MKPTKFYNNFHIFFDEDSKEALKSFDKPTKVIKAILPSAYKKFNKNATEEQLTNILYEYLVNISYLNYYSDSQIIRESCFASKKYEILNETIVKNIAEEVCNLKSTNRLHPIYSLQTTIFNPNITLSTSEKRKLMMKVNKPIMIKKSIETRKHNYIVRTTEKVNEILSKWHLMKYGYPTNKKLTLLTGIAEKVLISHSELINSLIEDKFITPNDCVKIRKEDLPKIESIDAVFHFAQDNNWSIKSIEDEKTDKLYAKIKELKIKKEDKMKLKLTVNTNNKKIKIECEIESDSSDEKLDSEIAIAVSFGKSYSSSSTDMFTTVKRRYASI